MVLWGTDVSRYQGNIDWEKVKADGIQFAFLKTVSTNKSFGGIYIDPYFERNYAECKRLGIPVGVYYYTYAQDIDYANRELAKLKEAISGKTFEFPIVIDVEDNLLKPISRDALTDLVIHAVETIESWKCYAMVYTYLYYSNTELNMDRLKPYDLWLAAYLDTEPAKPVHSIWQYTSTGRVNGINGNCDLNYSCKNYAPIIRNAGLNGFGKPVEWVESEKLLEITGENCEYFNSADIYDVAGKLPVGTIHNIATLSDGEIDGYMWATIEMTGGEYYVALVEGRTEIIDPAPVDICENCSAVTGLEKELTEEKIKNAILEQENKMLSSKLAEIVKILEV